MFKTLRLVAITAAFALLIAACGNGSGATTTTSGPDTSLELLTAGTLTVCTDTPYYPMEFVEGGEYKGFDMDLMRAVAADLGLGIAFNEPGWEAITGGLAFTSRECDVAAASITITEERAQALDFSNPYFSAEQSLLVRDDSGITSLATAVGHEIAVQTGTTGHFFLRDEGPEGVMMVEFAAAADPYLALQSGTVDGFLTDGVANQEYADTNPGFSVVETFATDEEYGWATKDTPNLLAALNATLAKFKSDGTFDRIYGEWFDG